MISGETIIYALLGGLLPSLLWLWFWRREDRLHPEPRRLILIAFIMGMLSIPFVIPIQKYTATIFSGGLLILIWAAIEEILKYSFAYFSVLRNKEMNEPIDEVLYMITIALGFAALENTLFLIEPLSSGRFVESVVTGNFRFLGATLLHVLSSATVGVFMAFAFYKNRAQKLLYTGVGIILAILLHSLFNFSIIKSNGTNILLVFAFVWAGIIILLLLLERIKSITNRCISYLKRK
ncbi:PrsW family intramembrane metalloprotease [Candidatus Kaiserbacteria bacterium]|nr:PrsW family intramembrane metalloprotease [Candidatus Kaiserbacteria bacterium]